MPKPNLAEVPAYYHNYINKVQTENLQEAFQQHLNAVFFLKDIPKDKWDFRYAEGKWSIKELVQHIIDGERIFSYRALCFARKDQTPLPSFDENLYAANSQADRRTADELIEELMAVQSSSKKLFDSFNEQQLDSKGVANNKEVSVRAIGFILVGHLLHHVDIIKERYL